MSDRAKSAAEMIASLPAETLVQALRLVPESTKRVIVDELFEEDAESAEAWSSELIRRAQLAHAGASKTSTVEAHLSRLRARLLK
jgi:hypothetical protein